MIDKTVFTILINRTITKGNAFLTTPTLVGDSIVDVPALLPAPIFLLSDYDSYYSLIMKEFLPEGVFLKSITKTSDKSGIILTYKNLADSIEETITIILDGRGYLTLINWTRSANMLLKRPKVRIDNALQADQFNQFYYYVRKSGITIETTDFFKPRDFEPDVIPNSVIRNIDQEIPIDVERGFCPMIIPYAGTDPIANGVTWQSGVTVFTETITRLSDK